MDADAPHLGFRYTDDDEKKLKKLLETFGYVVSLKDIASVYCETGRDLHCSAEMLSKMQGGTTATASKPQDNVNNISGASSGSLSTVVSENDRRVNLRQQKYSATMGSVSSVIGKDYIKAKPQIKKINEKLKPVKLHAEEFPVSEIWEEKKAPTNPSTSCGESMVGDVREFIYNMLADGFQLEMSVIRDVVGQCGYNVQVSMDRLLDLSAASLAKSDDVTGVPAGNVKTASKRTKADVNDGAISTQGETEKKNTEMEVLNALFGMPDRIIDKPLKCPVRPVRHSPYGRAVARPPKETIEDFTFITRELVNDKNDDGNEISYDELRKAVSEYWNMMKEYYKAAVEAYVRQDYENAHRLMGEGNFFMRKAREADEESAKKLIKACDEEEISLNLHYLDPRDARHQMKLNLKCYAGLPFIRRMKFVVGTNNEGAKDDRQKRQDDRRKRLITRFLEKEGIPWTEEGNGWTIAI